MAHNRLVSEVIATDEFKTWFRALDDADFNRVAFVVERLADTGVGLGAPYASAIKGASFALRELRPTQGRSPIRVFYAFDPARDAVLIIGGDKSGQSSDLFYDRMVRECEAIWRDYLAELAEGEEQP